MVMEGEMPGEGGHAEDIYEGQTQERSWDANVKRTYDEYQELALESARRTRLQFDQLAQVALQALQNAVETANMVSKNAVIINNKVAEQCTCHHDDRCKTCCTSRGGD